MKIGIVLSSTPSYSETFFISKIKGLKNNGFDVVLFVGNNKNNFDLCEVITRPKLRNILSVILLSLLNFSRVIKYIKLEKKVNTSYIKILKKVYLNNHILVHNDLDWLHFGFATSALGKENLAKVINAKMAVSLRGFDINVYPLKNENCYQYLWSEVDKIHSISYDLLDKAYDLGLESSKEFSVITPAVRIKDRLTKKNDKKDSEVIRLVTIARLNWIKGIEESILAMQYLKEESIKFEYHIIGGGKKEEIERYRYLVYSLGLKENIIFHGELSHEETQKKIELFDIYLQPSRGEGFCNSVLEAQALGKLCIVTNAGGLTENILNEETGWVVDNYRPLLIFKKIKEVISLSETEKSRVINTSLARVRKEFSIEKQEQDFVLFYKS